MSEVLQHQRDAESKKSKNVEHMIMQQNKSVNGETKLKSQQKSQIAKQDSKQISVKSKKLESKQQSKQMSQRQWDATYENQNFSIDQFIQKKNSIKQDKIQSRIQKGKSQKPESSKHQGKQMSQRQWDANYENENFAIGQLVKKKSSIKQEKAQSKVQKAKIEKTESKHDSKQMSQKQWDGTYENENFAIDQLTKKKNSIKQEKAQSKIQKGKSERRQENQQIYWDTAYIDQKFYLSDPASLTKLRQLDKQIKLQREKLANIEMGQQFDHSFLSQRNANDESTENLRMQCLTEINQSKLLQRKQHAEADLLKQQQKYRTKIEDMKKKKSILKKQIGCGTNDKNMQANQQQILKGQHQQKQVQKKQKSSRQNKQLQKSMKPEKDNQQSKKQVSSRQAHNGNENKSVKPKTQREVKRQESKVQNKVIETKKSQIQLKAEKSVKEKSVVKSSLQKQNKSEKDVEVSSPVRQKSSKQKSQRPDQDRKSQKSVQSKAKSSHPVELNLPKLPDTAKSQKSAVLGDSQTKKSNIDDKSVKNFPSNKQKSVIQSGVNEQNLETKNQIPSKVSLQISNVDQSKSHIAKSQKSAKSKANQPEQAKSTKGANQLQTKSQKNKEIQNKIENKSSKSSQVADKQQIQSNANKNVVECSSHKERDIEQQKSMKSKASKQVSSSSKVQKSETNKISQDKPQQKLTQKSKSNYLVPQIKLNSHSFKKTDKSVQWQQIQPSVSKFSVQKTQKISVPEQSIAEQKSQKSKSNVINQKSQKSKAVGESRAIQQSRAGESKAVDQKSLRSKAVGQSRVIDQSRAGQSRAGGESQADFGYERSQKKSNLNSNSPKIQESINLKPKNDIVQKSRKSGAYSQRSKQVTNHKDAYVVRVNEQKSKDSQNIENDEQDESQQSFQQNQMSKKMGKASQSEICHKQYEKSHESMSSSQIPSQKKKTSFKIHSRQNSVKSKKSHSKPNSIQKKKFEFEPIEKVSKNTVNQGKNIRQSSNSEFYNINQSRVNQQQMKRLHEQISQLQEKLKKVEEKQQQMIKFQNNQSKIMSELEGSNAGSEPASPLGKLALTSRLKLQAKLSLQGSTVQFNTYQQKLKQTAQQNQKLQKLKLQQQIGRLKKVIRDMQMQKIKSIQYDQNQSYSKVQIRRPSILDAQENNHSRISEKWKDSLNSDFLETKRNDWGTETMNNKEDVGKIKKNSPLKQSIKYHFDSPRKYNKINAEKSKQFSQMGKDQQKEQPPLPLRKKAQSVHGGTSKSRDITKQGLMNKFQQNQRNFHQFLQASRLVQQPESMVQPANQSMPEAFEHKHEHQLNPSQITNSPPEYKKTVSRNFSQIIQKLKNQNPEDEISIPEQIKVGNINMPNLPQCPNVTMSQDDLLDLAKKTYALFDINVDQDQNQLCMKKYKNCVVFTFGNSQQQTILWHYSGKFYFGGWKNTSDPGEGQKIGEGLQYIPGKHTYKGQFLGGKKNGNGILKMANGNVYDGQWVDGAKNGRGVYFESSTGTHYSGEWRDGKRDGYGILKFSNSQFYEGTFSKSIKQGYGVERFANGDYYKGQYQKGKFHGKGKYCWSNGSSYEGDFIEGLRHGQGSWKSSRKAGDIYIGGYQNDKKCGYGRYVWNNGCVYQGYFKNDLKNGKGRLVYQDGKQIKGSWQDGNLISSDQEARKMQDHEEQPLRRSIRASSLKNTMNSNQNSYRRPVNL